MAPGILARSVLFKPGHLAYVIGHCNPDADSVCSAIALAHLKNRVGNPDVRPARAGELDAETAHVLRRLMC